MNMLNGGAAQEVQLTAPAKKWQPPGGYDPKSRSASAASPAPVAGAPAIESAPVSAPKPAKVSTPAVQASAISQKLPEERLRALAEKWGYEPKDKSASAASPAASLPRLPVSTPAPAPARAPTLAQTQPSAPSEAREPSAAELRTLAEKWGYEASAPSKTLGPKSASSLAPAASAPKPVPAPAPASAPASEPEEASATVRASADRKWQPPGGYDPKSRRASVGGWGLADDDILRYIIYLIYRRIYYYLLIYSGE